jgi:hypothetical protein
MPKVNVQTLVLSVGYAEDAQLASVIMHHSQGFESVEEALYHIGECLVEVYRQPPSGLSKCCKESIEENYTFCSTCGRHLTKEDIEQETIESLAREFLLGTVDSSAHFLDEIYGTGWHVGDFNNGFNPFSYPTAVVYECADMAIAHCYLGNTEKENTFSPNVWKEHLAGHIHLLDKDIKIYKD